MRKLQGIVWLTGALALLSLPAAAQQAPVVSDSRIKTLVYNENDVYSLLTHYGYQSNVEFSDGERVKTVSVGDRVAWQIIPAGRRLFIKAMEENAHTNMTVVTNERAYQFDLKSSGRTPLQPDEELVYVVRFFYPEPEDVQPNPAVFSDQAVPVAMMPAAMPAPQPIMMQPLPVVAPPVPVAVQPLPAPVPPMQAPVAIAPPPIQPVVVAAPEPLPVPQAQPLPLPPQMIAEPVMMPAPVVEPVKPAGPNYLYTFEGSEALAPLKVFDDGQVTHMQFAQAPHGVSVLYLSADNRWETATPEVSADGYVTLPLVARQIVLDQPPHRIRVYNEALTAPLAQEVALR